MTTIVLPGRALNTAVVGIGRWGRNIARELASASHLVAYASTGSADNINWMSAQFPSARRMSITEICDDPAIEAAVVATPVSTHFPVARLLLEAGKHTLVEKPLAQSSAEAEELARTASSRGLILATGYTFLFHPILRELKDRIRSASIRKISLEWRKFGTFSESIELNLLTHHLALAFDLLGYPLHGEFRRGPGIRSECDSLEVRLFYGSAEVVSIIDRFSTANSHTINLHTTAGSRFLWNADRLLYAKDERAPFELVHRTKETALSAEITAFVDAASTSSRSPLPTGGRFGAHVLDLQEKLQEKLQTIE